MNQPSRVGLVVTGASRGFGRALAVVFAGQITKPIHFILSARTAADLDATAQLIKAARTEFSSPSDIIQTIVQDLNDLETLEQSAEQLFAPLTEDQHSYDEVYFVNNAGSLGPLTTIGDFSRFGLKDFSRLIDFNVTSSSFLTAAFTQR
jgi:NAD(P)-dependent dehydrogenase (short-subunit alcohol dehydrogenase family)